ncbi:class I SAM-dependent methyltransferase [Tsukamurella serpentis]
MAHHEHTGVDWTALADDIEAEGTVLLPYVHAALDFVDAQWPDLRPQRILDVGAGAGVMSAALAGHYRDAQVVAVDGAVGLLHRARTRGDATGTPVGILRADLPDDLEVLPTADLIWTAQTMHHLGDQRAAIAALAQRLNPGGLLAVAEGGLPTRFLPRDIGIGRPGLAERLDQAHSDGFTRMRSDLHGTVEMPEDWPGMLRSAGLVDVTARTFLVDRPAPLDDASRRAVTSMLARHLAAADRLDPGDAAVLRRLTDPSDPHSAMRRPDVFVLAARTVYIGTAR